MRPAIQPAIVAMKPPAGGGVSDAIELEDGSGQIELEDNSGVILLET